MLKSYSVCMAGAYHVAQGIGCQDSYAIAHTKKLTIGAVADGLGSKMFSDVGSKIASASAVDYCKKHCRGQLGTDEILDIIKDSFIVSYKKVWTEAARAGNLADEYDTTLSIVLYDGETLWYGHSGDSGIVVLLETGEYQAVTKQQRDADGGVYPLCAGPEIWEFGKVEKVSGVLLATDGVLEQICPPILKENGNINVAFTQQFMEYHEITKKKDIKKIEEAAYNYLKNYPVHLLNDDKTLVVIYNPENAPNKQHEDYYKMIDWKSLYEEVALKLYCD